MRSNETWEQRLTYALQADLDNKMSQLFPANAVDFEFSEAFETKMQKILNQARKPYYYLINTVGKRVAVIAIVFLIALTTTVFSVEALRKPVIEFFVTIFDQFSTVVFGAQPDHKLPSDDYYIPVHTYSDTLSERSSGIKNQDILANTSSKNIFSSKGGVSGSPSNNLDKPHNTSGTVTSHETVNSVSSQQSSLPSASESSSPIPSSSSAVPISSEQNPASKLPETIEKLCLPTIPEGYMLDFEDRTTCSYYMEYVNAKDEFFSFEQFVIQNNKITIDTKAATLTEVKVNQYDALYFENKGQGNLLWSDGEYGYFISGLPNQEFLLTIAESVK